MTMKRKRPKLIFLCLFTQVLITAVSCMVCETQNSCELSSTYFLLHHLGNTSITTEDFPEHDVVENCLSYLKEYGKYASRFIKCAVENARPFRFCEGCIAEYTMMSRIFSEIHKNEHGCHELLLDSDRVQVLTQINSGIVKIWTDAECEKCFDWVKEDDNGTVTYNYTEDTISFTNQYSNFTDCIYHFINGSFPKIKVLNKTVCTYCHGKYKDLNKHYMQLIEKANGQLCMDIVDMMNYTRLMWGESLKCTKFSKNDMPVLVTGLALLMTPVLFYVAVCVCGERRKLKLLTQKRMKKKGYDIKQQ